jgi:hypothetical protein
MSRRAHYSDDELAAFSLADKIGDNVPVPMEEVRRLLNTLASEGESTRERFGRAVQGLTESSKAKRMALHAVLTAG